MKKKYEKPVLIIEPFQLDATVAASCSSQGFVPIGYSENTCSIENGEFFGQDNCNFDLTAPGSGDVNDGFCYHGPELAGVTFVGS